jgi:hypothetical protein
MSASPKDGGSLILDLKDSFDDFKCLRKVNNTAITKKEVLLPKWKIYSDYKRVLQRQPKNDRKNPSSPIKITRKHSERICDQVPLSQDPNWGDDNLDDLMLSPSKVIDNSDDLSDDSRYEPYVCPDLIAHDNLIDYSDPEYYSYSNPSSPRSPRAGTGSSYSGGNNISSSSPGLDKEDNNSGYRLGDGFINDSTVLLLVLPKQLTDTAETKSLTMNMLHKRRLIHQARMRLMARQHIETHLSQSQQSLSQCSNSSSSNFSPDAIDKSSLRSISTVNEKSLNAHAQLTSINIQGLGSITSSSSTKVSSHINKKKSKGDSPVIQPEDASNTTKELDLKIHTVLSVTGFGTTDENNDSAETVIDFITHLCAYANSFLPKSSHGTTVTAATTYSGGGRGNSGVNHLIKLEVDSERALADVHIVERDKRHGLYFYNPSSRSREEAAMLSPATVLIVPYSTTEKPAPRSLHVLHALARGVPIVTQEWVDVNIASATFDGRDDKEHMGDCVISHWNGYRADRYAHLPLQGNVTAAKSKVGPLAEAFFANKDVYVGQSTNPSPAFIKSVVQWTGGKIVKDTKKADYLLFGTQNDYDQWARDMMVSDDSKFACLSDMCNSGHVLTFRCIADSLEVGYLMKRGSKGHIKEAHTIKYSTAKIVSDRNSTKKSVKKGNQENSKENGQMGAHTTRKIATINSSSSCSSSSSQSTRSSINKRGAEVFTRIKKEPVAAKVSASASASASATSSTNVRSSARISSSINETTEELPRKRRKICPYNKCRPEKTCVQCRALKVVVFVEGAEPLKNPTKDIIAAERAVGIKRTKKEEEQQKMMKCKKQKREQHDIPSSHTDEDFEIVEESLPSRSRLRRKSKSAPTQAPALASAPAVAPQVVTERTPKRTIANKKMLQPTRTTSTITQKNIKPLSPAVSRQRGVTQVLLESPSKKKHAFRSTSSPRSVPTATIVPVVNNLTRLRPRHTASQLSPPVDASVSQESTEFDEIRASSPAQVSAPVVRSARAPARSTAQAPIITDYKSYISVYRASYADNSDGSSSTDIIDDTAIRNSNGSYSQNSVDEIPLTQVAPSPSELQLPPAPTRPTRADRGSDRIRIGYLEILPISVASKQPTPNNSGSYNTSAVKSKSKSSYSNSNSSRSSSSNNLSITNSPQELRIDSYNGLAYTKTQFLRAYGNLTKWNISAAAVMSSSTSVVCSNATTEVATTDQSTMNLGQVLYVEDETQRDDETQVDDEAHTQTQTQGEGESEVKEETKMNVSESMHW